MILPLKGSNDLIEVLEVHHSPCVALRVSHPSTEGRNTLTRNIESHHRVIQNIRTGHLVSADDDGFRQRKFLHRLYGRAPAAYGGVDEEFHGLLGQFIVAPEDVEIDSSAWDRDDTEVARSFCQPEEHENWHAVRWADSQTVTTWPDRCI